MAKIDPIDRIALLEMLPQICDELNGCSAPYNFDEHCMGCEVYMLHKMLTDMPTLDVQPARRGEWRVTEAWPHRVYCSNCYTLIGQSNVSGDVEAKCVPRTNFCHECGADMRRVNTDDV